MYKSGKEKEAIEGCRKEFVMAKNGLDKWFAQKWVDIGE